MKHLQTIVLFALICLLVPEASADDYLIVGTQANGGGAIYEVNGGSLRFIENLPAVENVPWGARATYYHEANDTLYFAEGDSPAEWSVPAVSLRSFDRQLSVNLRYERRTYQYKGNFLVFLKRLKFLS